MGRGLKTAPSRRPRGLSSNLSTDEPVRDRRSAARSEAPGCGTSVVQRARGPGPPQTSSPAPHRSTHRPVLNPDAQARSSSPVRRNKNIGACHALLARLVQASSRAGSSNLRAPSPSPGATPGRARSEHLQPRYAPRGKWHHVEIALTNRRVFVCSIDGKPQSGKWFTPGTLRPKVADGPWRVILDRKLEEFPPSR